MNSITLSRGASRQDGQEDTRISDASFCIVAAVPLLFGLGNEGCGLSSLRAVASLALFLFSLHHPPTL